MRKVYFECEKEEEGFDGVVAAINEVAQEEVVTVGRVPANAEQLEQILELAVDVAAHLHTFMKKLTIFSIFL